MTQVRLKCKICGKEETIQICTRSLEMRSEKSTFNSFIPNYIVKQSTFGILIVRLKPRIMRQSSTTRCLGSTRTGSTEPQSGFQRVQSRADSLLCSFLVCFYHRWISNIENPLWLLAGFVFPQADSRPYKYHYLQRNYTLGLGTKICALLPLHTWIYYLVRALNP